MKYCFRLGCESGGDADSSHSVVSSYRIPFKNWHGEEDVFTVILPFCNQLCELGFLEDVLAGKVNTNILKAIIDTHRFWLETNGVRLNDDGPSAIKIEKSQGSPYTVRLKVPTAWKFGCSEAIIELTFSSFKTRLDFSKECQETLNLLEYLMKNICE